MDIPVLPARLQVAGAEYLRQLRRLGLKPEGCLWVSDVKQQRFMLWLIWSGVDSYGPYDVTKLLFKAYRSSVLTREIDPFIVDIRSPMDHLGAQILRTRARADAIRKDGVPVLFRITSDGGETVEYLWSEAWLYELRRSVKDPTQVKHDWDRFNRNISNLAA